MREREGIRAKWGLHDRRNGGEKYPGVRREVKTSGHSWSIDLSHKKCPENKLKVGEYWGHHKECGVYP